MERTTEGKTGLYLLSFIQGEPGALGQLGFRVKSKLNANVTLERFHSLSQEFKSLLLQSVTKQENL